MRETNKVIYLMIIIIGLIILLIAFLFITDYSNIKDSIKDNSVQIIDSIEIDKKLDNINLKLDDIIDQSGSVKITNKAKEELVNDYTDFETSHKKNIDNYSKINFIINWLEERGYIK